MGSALLELRVIPKASKDAIMGWHGGALKIKVRAAPEDGRANKAVIELLSEILLVPKSAITIESGHGSRQKRVCVDRLPYEAAKARLDAAIAGR